MKGISRDGNGRDERKDEKIKKIVYNKWYKDTNVIPRQKEYIYCGPFKTNIKLSVIYLYM